MELLLRRIALMDTYTIGRLSVNGVYFCDTLEDKVRDFNKDGDLLDDGEQKVYGETAIPYGNYKVTMNVVSPKFSQKPTYQWCKGRLPRLLNVPHFEGILIHAGVNADSSHGCIICGRNTEIGKVSDSMNTLKRLWNILDSTKESIIIKIQ